MTIRFAVILSSIALGIGFLPSAGQSQTLGTVEQELAGPGRYWPSGTIPVCLHPDSSFTTAERDGARDDVRRAIESSWARHTALEFTGYGTCSADQKGIRIKLKRSGIGQASGSLDRERFTISLPLPVRQRTVAHEVGHALGFGHSQVREDTPTWCFPSWGGTHPPGVIDHLTAWDMHSVMNYCRRPLGDPNELLSPLDIAGAIAVYGSAPGYRLGMNEAGDLFGGAFAVGDFDDDGVADVAIGAMGEGIGAEDDAGAVFVYRGNGAGALLPWTGLTQKGLGRNEARDLFGFAVVAANLDGEGPDELVVSAPQEIPGDRSMRSGALFVFRHDGKELTPWKAIVQEPDGRLPDVRRQGERATLGRALVAGDLDGDGRDEVYATTADGPGADVRGVVIGYAWDAARDEFVVRSVLEDPQIGGPSSLFGRALAIGRFFGPGSPPLLAVGSPRARSYLTDDSRVRSGRVDLHDLSGATPRLVKRLHQSDGARAEDGDGFGSSLAVGDFDGDGTDDLAVGVPDEDIGSASKAGVVSVFRGGSSVRVMTHIDQGTTGRGRRETDDRFGAHLVSGDFDGDGVDDLGIDAPGEVTRPTKGNPGFVLLAHGGGSGFGPYEWISQLPLDANEDRDGFGHSSVAMDLDRDGVDELVVGARGKNTGGKVFVFRTPYRPMEPWYAFEQEP